MVSEIPSEENKTNTFNIIISLVTGRGRAPETKPQRTLGRGTFN